MFALQSPAIEVHGINDFAGGHDGLVFQAHVNADGCVLRLPAVPDLDDQWRTDMQCSFHKLCAPDFEVKHGTKTEPANPLDCENMNFDGKVGHVKRANASIASIEPWKTRLMPRPYPAEE